MDRTKPMIVEESDSDWETGAHWKLLLGAERTATAGLTVGIAEIPPGPVKVPEEKRGHHHAEVEVYYVISGHGRILIDGEEFAIKPGSTIYIPGNADHRTTNTGDVPLKLLWCFPTDSLKEVIYHRNDGTPPGPILV